MMATDRRTFLALLASTPLWPYLNAQATERRIYLSARATDDRQFRISGFDSGGQALFDLSLPGRGHSLAVHPRQPHCIAFARRPGQFAEVIDLDKGEIVTTIDAAPSRHFYGHGVFDPRGDLLYATENDYDGERGMIGVYDATDSYRRVGEFPSYGIGPHDIRLLADGTTLVVAIGGILTHPDMPRVELNLPTMQPALVYLDRRDGRLLEKIVPEPELHQLSIRHLAANDRDTVAIAMQYQGPRSDDVPIVALHRRGRPLTFCQPPTGGWQVMRQYGGSMAFDSSGEIIAASSPRGNRIVCWRSSGEYLQDFTVTDGCGIASAGRSGQSLASSGAGGVVLLDALSGRQQRFVTAFDDTGHWDNHLITV